MIFQSTRPSRASTIIIMWLLLLHNFNPQGPRGPRLHFSSVISFRDYISIHKALAGLDLHSLLESLVPCLISIHKALAGLDEGHTWDMG